ncbi:carbohydrate sulfotransferase 8-like, partial [Macrotis lagotis]|uniref:carbohydrate sulfotransferase 8-like n=1 Tax=Macrotis lagotis TaxID=92651 RepID=UPI003D696C39
PDARFPPLADGPDAWVRSQQRRRERLAEACRKLGLGSNRSAPLAEPVARQLLLEPNHRLLYCEVPKAGCSNWRRVLLLLTLNRSRADPREVRPDLLHRTGLLRRLNSVRPQERGLVLGRYRSLLVSRHPLERLVSAYRDKLLHSEPYYRHVAAVMRAAVRGRRAQDQRGNLTFSEFVTFVLRQKPEALDVHWRPVERLCSPCRVGYGLLLHHESLSAEAGRALGSLGISLPGSFPSAKEHARERRTDPGLTRLYLRQLSPQQLSGLHRLYHLDFALFGYEPLDLTAPGATGPGAAP